MQITTSDTGEVKNLSLQAELGGENIIEDFIKDMASVVANNKELDFKKAFAVFQDDAVTEGDLKEWEGIIGVAQKTAALRLEFKSIPWNSIHGLIEHEIKETRNKHLHSGLDNKFALKNAVDAELVLFDRLLNGVVSIKDPVTNPNNPDGPKISNTLKITHFRHTSDESGDNWLMQIYCDFFMRTPCPGNSFDFKAGIELRFHKPHDGKIEYVDDDTWIFPFSMSDAQEEVVLIALHGAAWHNFTKLGYTEPKTTSKELS